MGKKINILDDFAPRVENVKLEFESNCDRKESIVEVV